MITLKSICILLLLALQAPRYHPAEMDDAGRVALFAPADVEYWRSLAPNMHIYDAQYFQQQDVFPSSLINGTAVSEQILQEGYSQLEPLEWGISLDAMVELIERLHTLGVPITFCFMYDEFWYMFMRLHGTLQGVLGPEYQRLPDFWAWRVDPKQSERGWHVHRDKNYETLYTDGMPKSLSVWIPLTEATTSNGCMYVLPADRDPTYRRLEEIAPHFTNIAGDVRALPIKAGNRLHHYLG
jgi:hypothetical protein